MPNDTKRGIGAVMMAIGAIGLVLWLAVARLSPDTALSPFGIVIAAGTVLAIVAGFHFSRSNR